MSASNATLAQMFWNRVEASAPLAAQTLAEELWTRGCLWCDWGGPDRVFATLARRGLQSDWAAAMAEPA